MLEFRRFILPVSFIVIICFSILLGLFAYDKFELMAPNGISFGEVKGYEKWQVVAPSYRTDVNELRVILANDTMIKAYQSEIPGSGKTFPEGSVIVKIGYSLVKNPDFDAATVPDKLKRVEFIIKDSKRFPTTSGWGYARFIYDPDKDIFTPFGTNASFAEDCFSCHTAVKDQDYIFTGYPKR